MSPLQLSQRLSITRFPYIGLLGSAPDGRVQLIASAAGPCSVDSLLRTLSGAVDSAGVLLAAQRAEQQERVSTQAELDLGHMHVISDMMIT